MTTAPQERLAIKEDFTLNIAQSMLYAMGIRPELLFAHHKEPSLSFTKKGPGRVSAHKTKPVEEVKAESLRPFLHPVA